METNNWKLDKITPKQEKTIIKMKSILGWKVNVPETKGDACKLIGEMMKEADKRIAITGTMGYNPEFDGYGMSDLDDIDDQF